MPEKWTLTRTVTVQTPIQGSAYCGVLPERDSMIYEYCVSLSVCGLDGDGWIADARAVETAIENFEHLRSCEQNVASLAGMVKRMVPTCVSCRVTQRQRIPRGAWSDSVVSYEWTSDDDPFVNPRRTLSEVSK